MANIALCSGHAQVSGTIQKSPLPQPGLPLQTAVRPLLTSPDIHAFIDSLHGRALTIDDVVSIALSTNRTLASQLENYLNARGETVLARSGLGPTASMGVTYDAYSSASVVSVGGQSITTTEQYQKQYTASLSLPIDITGELKAAVSQKKFLEIAARIDIGRARNEIVSDTKTAFYAVLRAEAIVKVAEDSLQNSVDSLADSQLRLEAGTVARLDVTTAKSKVATSQQTLINDQNSLAQAFASLNETVGIDVNTSFAVSSQGALNLPPAAEIPYVAPAMKPRSLPENTLELNPLNFLANPGALQASKVKDFSTTDPLPVNDQYRSLLKEALAKRPEILREDANISAARKGIFVAKAGSLPTLSVGYNYAYDPDAGSLGVQHSSYGSLTLNIPLFDSGAAHGRLISARSDLATSETNRRTEVDSITLEVRKAYLNLQSAELSIWATREALGESDESYRLARLRYTTGVTSQAGISPLIEVSNAQDTLAQAQSNYVNALYDYNNDRSILDKAVGRYAEVASTTK